MAGSSRGPVTVSLAEVIGPVVAVVGIVDLNWQLALGGAALAACGFGHRWVDRHLSRWRR